MAKEKPLGLKVSAGIYAFIGLLSILVTVLGAVALVFIPTMVSELTGTEYAADGAVDGPSSTVGEALVNLQETSQTFFTLSIVIAGVFGIIYLLIAYFLWKANNNARYAATVFSVLGLLSFPLGTILHAIVLYMLWLDKDTKAVFA